MLSSLKPVSWTVSATVSSCSLSIVVTGLEPKLLAN
jgi:hypothetical protein